MFADRFDAGRQLARALAPYRSDAPLVLALPRGGVPVAVEVAQALGAPLDVILVRKIGAPGQPELAIGALVDGDPPQLLLNDDLVAATGADEDYIAAEREAQEREIARRRELYRGRRPPPRLRDRTVIVVDDGIATGATLRVALQALGRAGAARIIAAVPVAPADALPRIREEADEVIVLETPRRFQAVGAHYRDFDQTSDAQVVDILRRAGDRA